MNVWFVNHYAVPPSATGITRHHDLAKHLAPLGVDASIIASSFDHYSRTHRGDGSPLSVEIIDGIRYCWVRTPEYGAGTAARSRNMISFATTLARQFDEVDLPRPDHVVGSSPHLLAPLAARRIARKMGARFVLEIRDVWPESLVELGGPPKWHPAILALGGIEKSLYRTADHIVSVLPAAADHIRERAGHDVAVTWIPNGSEVPDEPPPSKQPGSPFNIVYAGTIGNANNLDVVVDAADHLERRGDADEPEILWRIVGLGPERSRLEARVDEFGLRTVRFEGPVPSTQVPEVLASADACLLHLMDSPVFRWGVSPNKLFDYMRAARPVIFAVRAPIDAVAEAGSGISIEPSSPVALAEAAVQLASTPPTELQLMGHNGFEYLRQNHALGELASRYEKVFRRLG